MDRKELQAALEVVVTVGQAIRELGSVPSGVLYAHLCGTLELTQFQSIIGILKSSGMVSERGHVLTWTGPESAVRS